VGASLRKDSAACWCRSSRCDPIDWFLPLSPHACLFYLQNLVSVRAALQRASGASARAIFSFAAHDRCVVDEPPWKLMWLFARFL
jgi:hypothetical protein